MRTQHDGDCTIYALLHNRNPESGICVCGYGWQLVREGNWDEMYSKELQDKLKKDFDSLQEEQRDKINGLMSKLIGGKLE